MPLIATQSPETASGEVAEIYAQIQAKFGHVPNAFRIWSGNPVWFKQMWEYIGYYMQHPHLSFATLAALRMLVSVKQDCAYCVDMNAAMLIGMANWTPEQVAATRADVTAAPLPEKDRALIALVLKAVRDANAVDAGDVQAMRDLGWSDLDIFDAINHGARQVAGDIIFNAFKIERDY